MESEIYKKKEDIYKLSCDGLKHYSVPEFLVNIMKSCK